MAKIFMVVCVWGEDGGRRAEKERSKGGSRMRIEMRMR